MEAACVLLSLPLHSRLEGFGGVLFPDGISTTKLRAAAAAALGAAAIKARIMAECEEREALRLTQQLIETQHRKLTTKLRTFEQMEESLLKEKSVMEVRALPAMLHSPLKRVIGVRGGLLLGMLRRIYCCYVLSGVQGVRHE